MTNPANCNMPTVSAIQHRPQFLTTFTFSLMKSLDIRSEPAIRLLAEFLDMDDGGERVNAEHFAHGECGYIDCAIFAIILVYSVRVLLKTHAACNIAYHAHVKPFLR